MDFAGVSDRQIAKMAVCGVTISKTFHEDDIPPKLTVSSNRSPLKVRLDIEISKASEEFLADDEEDGSYASQSTF
jgi:hypothetical protein